MRAAMDSLLRERRSNVPGGPLYGSSWPYSHLTSEVAHELSLDPKPSDQDRLPLRDSFN